MLRFYKIQNAINSQNNNEQKVNIKINKSKQTQKVKQNMKNINEICEQDNQLLNIVSFKQKSTSKLRSLFS